MGGAATRIRLGKVTRRTVAIDAGVAALVFGLTVVVLAARGLGTPDPAARPLDGVGVLLAAASAMPLLAWRRVPLAVYVATSAAVITLVALDHPVDFPFGPVVVLYALAVANSGDAPPLRRRAAMLAAGLFVPAATVAYLANGHPVRGSLPGLGFWALICAGVWITGEHTRLRRERIGELEEQAARAHRERVRERRLAAAEERTRIARELHDSAGHAINVILVQAGAARLLHERDPEGSRRAIATVEQVARATIGEFDQLVRALREDDAPQAAVPADPAALDQLLEHHRSSGLVLTTDVRGQDRSLPPTVTWAAYRILQEALTNAVRHGRGSAGVAVVVRARRGRDHRDQPDRERLRAGRRPRHRRDARTGQPARRDPGGRGPAGHLPSARPVAAPESHRMTGLAGTRCARAGHAASRPPCARPSDSVATLPRSRPAAGGAG